MRDILAVHPSDELYGADRVLLQVVEVLERRGDVRVWLPADVDYGSRPLSRELAERGVPVSVDDVAVLRREHARPRAVPGLLARMWRTFQALRRRRPDLVYVNTSAMLLVAPLARLVGARVVAHIHESWGRAERIILGPPLWSCHQVLAVSAAVAARLPVPASRVVVVHNGVDAPEPVPGGRAAVREALEVGDADTLVIVASRWNRWKGVDVLLEAWSLLDRHDLHLAVLGGPPPSGTAIDVVGAVDAMTTPARVSIVGETEDVAPWFAAADVVAVPSIEPDPFPLVAVEAAAHGRAVYASRIGGLPEMVVDGLTGQLLAPGDVGGWTAAFTCSSREHIDAAGRAAARRQQADFTHAAFARRLDAALRAGGLP